MKTRNYFVLVIAFFSFLLIGCDKKEEKKAVTKQDSTVRQVTDMNGKKVSIPAQNATFGVFGGPISQIPYLLGAQDSVVAVTKGAQMMEMMLAMDPGLKNKSAPRATNGNVNIESLLAANPDCVIAFDVDGKIVEKHTDIPVIFLSGNMGAAFDELREEVLYFGQVFQKQERANNYIQYLNKTLKMIKDRLGDIPVDQRKRIFVGEGSSHLQTLGGDTFITKWMEAAMCHNAILDVNTTVGQHEGMHTGFMEISMEQVIASNPDMIIIDRGNPSDLKKDLRWKEIKAVRENKVYTVPSGVFLWSRPSAESAVLYPLWMAFNAYPEKFSDLSYRQELKTFYKEIFNYEISNQQAEKIEKGKMGRVVFGKKLRKKKSS